MGCDDMRDDAGARSGQERLVDGLDRVKETEGMMVGRWVFKRS
jgi:hypothetical protein